MNDFEVFISILLLSSFNIPTNQRDYWSTDDDLRCDGVVRAMSRNKFFRIKSNLKYSMLSDKNNADKTWRVRKIIDIFRSNALQFGYFSTVLSVDKMMVKFFDRTSLK